MSHEHATAPVYPFGAPGAEIVLWEGDLTVGDKTSSGRLWMTMTGDVSFRWALDPAGWRSLRLGETRLAFEHPDLGALDVPGRVTSTAGSGIVESTTVGGALQLDEIVVHWVNVPASSRRSRSSLGQRPGRADGPDAAAAGRSCWTLARTTRTWSRRPRTRRSTS